MKTPMVLVAALGLAACAAVNSATTSIEAGCQGALPLANMAAPLPVIGLYVAAGVQVACAANGIARLASDPTSAAWLAQQTGMLRTALRL